MFDKKLVAAAAASGLMAIVTTAWSQVATTVDPATTADQSVQVTGPTDKAQILYFADQGNSPETDPAAHLMLIKEAPPAPPPVAAAEAPTQVAEATPAQTTSEPAQSTQSTQEASPPQTETWTERSTAADNQSSMPAPRADRN